MDMADIVRVVEPMKKAETDRERVRRCRDRAEECRMHAAAMKDLTARAGLIQVAENYERMADAIARALGHGTPSDSN